MEFLSLTWPKLHTNVFDLAKRIEHGDHNLDVIVAIARGGLTISHIASDFLSLPITSFTVSSYQDLTQHKAPEVTFNLGDSLHGKRILLMDDVSDTGKTFIRAMKYLKKLGAEDITTAAVFYKPWSEYKPDYFVQETNKWIVFPYDVRETIEAIQHTYQKQNKSDEELDQKLNELHIADIYLKAYKKK